MKKHSKPVRIFCVVMALVMASGLMPLSGMAVEDTPEPEPTFYVAVYTTTTPYYTATMVASNSRIPQETESVYFALSTDGVNYEVVNWGGGVIFAPSRYSNYTANSGAAFADPNNPTNAALNSGNNGTRIRNPKIFFEAGAEKPFRVIAHDMATAVGYYEYSSADGVNFYDVVRIPNVNNVDPIYAATPTLSKADITLSFKGQNLLATDPGITMGNAVEITAEQYQYYLNKLTPIYNDGLEPVEDFRVLAGEAITVDDLQAEIPTVTATYSDTSSKPFKVDWAGALDDVDFNTPGEYEITGKVIQTRYLNRLKELNGSTTPDDDPARENLDFPTNINVATGEVFYDATKFVEGLADPQIWWDAPTGYYYMTGSYFPQLGIDELPGEVLHGSNNQYDRIAIRRAKTLAGLQRRIPPADVMDPDAIGQVPIWKTANQPYYNNPTDRAAGNPDKVGRRNIWAPQIHRMAYEGPCEDHAACDAAFYANGGLTPCKMGWWVVYFTQNIAASGTTTGIVSNCIVLPGHRDPFETALKSADQVSEWINYRVLHPSYTNDRGVVFTTAQITAANPRHYGSLTVAFNLDLDYFRNEVTGDSYLCWTGKPMFLGNGNTDIFLAKMDPTRPWEVITPETRLTYPDFGWERISYQVNEGTTTIQKDGKIYLAFSGAGTGSEYAIGMLVADATADLLAYAPGSIDSSGKNGRPANWQKSPFPVLSSRHVDGEEGPGHNSFSKDEEGNDIFVYHARPTSHNHRLCGTYGSALGDACRHARIKRVHWAADGTPIINMTYDDELRPENRTVTTTITVYKLVDMKTSAKDFVSLVETSKNSRVWVLTFEAIQTFSDGEVSKVRLSFEISANNMNVDGKYNFGEFTLIYDIKGNGSNIKDFRIVMN